MTLLCPGPPSRNPPTPQNMTPIRITLRALPAEGLGSTRSSASSRFVEGHHDLLGGYPSFEESERSGDGLQPLPGDLRRGCCGKASVSQGGGQEVAKDRWA